MIEKLLKEAQLHKFVNISAVAKNYGISSKTVRSYLKGNYPTTSKEFAIKIINEALEEAEKIVAKIKFKEIKEALNQ
jgi:predicted transcriptional regulator